MSRPRRPRSRFFAAVVRPGRDKASGSARTQMAQEIPGLRKIRIDLQGLSQIHDALIQSPPSKQALAMLKRR